MKDKELSQLTKEVNQLRKLKERKLKLSTSYEERNRLLAEIRQLEAIKQSPSKMKSFGSTFGRGLKVVGGNLWSAVKRGSANLSRNSPEFRDLGNKKSTHNQAFSPLASVYLPQQVAEPMMMSKKQKKKLKKIQARKLNKKIPHPFSWELQ